MAFFVAFVGTRFWRIVCLGLHYFYSSTVENDGIYHQRQAFLRNAPNPEFALWMLTDIGFSWRRRAEKVWQRLLPVLVLAFCCLVGFTLASGYSSHIATFTSSEVLLSGNTCAIISNDVNMSSFANTIGPVVAEEMLAAEIYARQCYSSSNTGALTCNTFVKTALPPMVVDTNASCPFDPKVCKSPNGNLFLDSGLLDSHHDFGRNTPPNQRVQYRRLMHCAPLATEGYRVRMYDEERGQSSTVYYYGGQVNVNGSISNYTTQFSDTYLSVEDLTHSSSDTIRDFSIRYVHNLTGSLLF